MASRIRRSNRALFVAPAALLLALWIAAPALGHHSPGHDGGPPAHSNAGGNGQANGQGATGGTSSDLGAAETQVASTPDSSANSGCGEYCATPGFPSGNGNNGGAPHEAGSKGNADNKNPKGQRPNGSDHNNGYECDGNSGIARGNPAHSACSPSVTPPPVNPPPVNPPPVNPPPVNPPPVNPPPVNPPPGPPPGGPGGAEVLGEQVTNPTAVAAGSEKGQELAFTGITAAPIVIAALGLAALGGILIFAGRRRQGTRS